MPPRIIAVLNPKGGSGKTTLAIHLASALQQSERTLLVDSDIQGSSRDWGAVRPQPSPLAVIGLDRPSLDRDIQAFGDDYAWIVIDGAAKLEKMMASAIKAADLVLIPVQPSPLDLWACAPLVDVIQARQVATDGRPSAAFVLNGVKKGTKIARECGRPLGEFGLPVLRGAIHHRTVLARSLIDGSTALDLDPNGEAAFEVWHVVRQIREAFA